MLWELTNVGVDWLTATTKSRDAFHDVLNRAASWSTMMAELEVKTELASVLGYDGIQTGKLFIGERADGFMLRASSWEADSWYDVMKDDRWKPTRIDLQVTGKAERDVPDYALLQSANALQHRNTLAGGRPYKVVLVQSFGRGDTVNVGSRSSERYGRLYDKHRETKAEYPAGTWRWELETKGETAQAANKALREAQDRQTLISGMVTGYFESRGIILPPELSAAPAVMAVGKVERSVDKSLAWLRQHVRPTVERLYKEGYGDAVLSALGLTDL